MTSRSLDSQASTVAPAVSLLASPKSAVGEDEDGILRSTKRASLEELIANIPSCDPVSVRLLGQVWVSPPTSAGALSCLRLAEVLSSMGEVTYRTRKVIAEGRAIEKIVANLASISAETREAAGVALEQISITREPLFLSKLLSDKALLVVGIRLAEGSEELRGCMSNIVYSLYKDNRQVKTYIAQFQGGRILHTMVEILPQFSDVDLMRTHAQRLREFYRDMDGRVDRELLASILQAGLGKTIGVVAEVLRGRELSEELQGLVAEMTEEVTK
jgi:hypothetical protein